MKKKFLYGLAWGSGITFPVVIGIIFLFIFLDKGKEYLNHTEYRYEDIKGYEIISPSHRIIEGTRYDDGLYITGEAKLSSKVNYAQYDLINVRAELRNEKGGLVGNCNYQRMAKYIKNNLLKFGINCERIKSLKEFSSYELYLEGRLED